MPVTYRIEASRHLVLSHAWEAITPQEAIAHLRELAADSEFDPSFNHLYYGTEIANSDATAAQIRAIVNADPFGPRSRRAAALSRDYAFGMARMYEVFAEEAGGQFRVFRSIEEARVWLGVGPTIEK